VFGGGVGGGCGVTTGDGDVWQLMLCFMGGCVSESSRVQKKKKECLWGVCGVGGGLWGVKRGPLGFLVLGEKAGG